MITLQAFLDGVEQNANRTKQYRQPGDGSDGTCDCIGLIIGARRLAGDRWNGLHGSNYAARYEMVSLAKVTSEADFFLGEVVFKAHEPGENGYALPSRYLEGGAKYNGDMLDYYHVGVVTSVNPLTITHCTTVGGPIARDHEKRRWAYGGIMKGIDYSELGLADYEVKDMVTLAGGNVKSPINMRENKSVLSKRLAEIPQNTEVELVEAGSEWSRVSYNGVTGYVLTKFVQFSPEDGGESAEPDMIIVDRNVLEQAYDILGDLLGLRG